MLELLICDVIRKGYKVVIPKNQNLRLAPKYMDSVYTNPSQVRSGDKLKFIGWTSANEKDRNLWKEYL
jgi:hypothetical protein